MATILELANHADVSAENVLRVVNGEPVSSVVAERVRAAVEALGPPPFPGSTLEPLPVQASLDRTHRQLLETFAETAAGLEAKLPEDVGSVVYEALRVEVRPVTARLAQMGALVEHLLERLGAADEGRALERKERLDDVALITELIVAGWRSVDRRLGRLERMIEELAPTNGGADRERVTRYVYLDPPSSPSTD
jgi:hypothetical protein